MATLKSPQEKIIVHDQACDNRACYAGSYQHIKFGIFLTSTCAVWINQLES